MKTLTADYDGYCPICEENVRFLVQGPWLRDQLLCSKCWSVPRERALFAVLQMLFPNWRDLRIHEGSPIERGTSECPGYVSTQFDPGAPLGCSHPVHGWRNEDLERQTFDTGCFDLVVTQDVFEHLFHPDMAIREIARTLKPGGASIMSVPIVLKERPHWACPDVEAATTAMLSLVDDPAKGRELGTSASIEALQLSCRGAALLASNW